MPDIKVIVETKIKSLMKFGLTEEQADNFLSLVYLMEIPNTFNGDDILFCKSIYDLIKYSE